MPPPTSLNFEWDPAKAATNLVKHAVSFAEATEVFADGLSSTAMDPDHSEGEERHLIFGRTLADKYLVVSFTERSGTIRLISARAMTRQERRAYER